MAQPTGPAGFDELLAPWREWRDKNMQILAKSMSEYVGTEAFAQSLGNYMEMSLATTGPMQTAFDNAMKAQLERLSMPSKDDVVSLAGRLTNIEMRLDDLDAKIDGLPKPAPIGDLAARTGKLDDRLAALETKLDRLLAAIEPTPADASAARADTARRSRKPAE